MSTRRQVAPTAFQAALRAGIRAGALSDELDVHLDRALAGLGQLNALAAQMGMASERLMSAADPVARAALELEDRIVEERSPRDVVLRYVRRCLAQAHEMAQALESMRELLEAKPGASTRASRRAA